MQERAHTSGELAGSRCWNDAAPSNSFALELRRRSPLALRRVTACLRRRPGGNDRLVGRSTPGNTGRSSSHNLRGQRLGYHEKSKLPAPPPRFPPRGTNAHQPGRPGYNRGRSVRRSSATAGVRRACERELRRQEETGSFPQKEVRRRLTLGLTGRGLSRSCSSELRAGTQLISFT